MERNCKGPLFTTHLLQHVDAFLPSRVDAALKKSKFPELRTARTLDLSLFRAGCERHRKALAILQRMAMVDDVGPLHYRFVTKPPYFISAIYGFDTILPLLFATLLDF